MDTSKFDHIPEDELWVTYKKTHSAEIREYFIVKYAPLTKYVAGKISSCLPSHVEFEDIVGYGVFGLLDAIINTTHTRACNLIHTPSTVFEELYMTSYALSTGCLAPLGKKPDW